MSYRPPRGWTFDRFEVGQAFVCPARTVTEADVVCFAGLSGDDNPLHMDEEFARATPAMSRVAHGVLVLAIATGQANQLGVFEGTTIALMKQTVRYLGAVKLGDSIHLELRVAGKRETSKPDRGVLTLGTRVLNQCGEAVMEGEWIVMMRRGEKPDRAGREAGNLTDLRS